MAGARTVTPLLLSTEQLAARRVVASGDLAPLADSLAADLTPLLDAPPYIPAEKALLSRVGGRCETDGTDLAFDPRSPHAHRCPACGRVHTGEWHDRWWLYPYQLWLAERVVHAATLFTLRGDERHAAYARAVLRGYAGRYLDYPNRDNVLGPSRLFFSTYLESLWLLHVCVAADLLESTGDVKTASLVRDRIAEPAVQLIEEYHEGTSNRQVWNSAAIVAAHTFLGEGADSEAVGGALADTESAVLQAVGEDGAWYEGDNYHQFAHRGLWYVIALGERLGYEFQGATRARFDAGFAAPFRSALPDFTLPARKDSRYAASLRQWRFAESCELGLARTDDALLQWALARMYADDIPAGDTGRARSSGEAERNTLPVRLSRADLGWRSLLFARRALPSGEGAAPASVTLASQGLTIHRREQGAVYVALDWGESGGGHGHPDRLNLLFSHGATRWLDDLGTGSYVDPSLHWYRSTLAHNAPLVNGASQFRVNGQLTALARGDGFDIVSARVDGIADGARVERTLVTAQDYFIDEVRWWADRPVRFDLPMHFDGATVDLAFAPAELHGAGGVEDGFDFVRDAERAAARADSPVTFSATRDGRASTVAVWSDHDTEWFRATGLGQPATTVRRFHVARQDGTSGTIRSVWSWGTQAMDARSSTDTRSSVDARSSADARFSVDARSSADARFSVDARSSVDARFSAAGVDVVVNGAMDRHLSSLDGWHVHAANGGELAAARMTAPPDEPPDAIGAGSNRVAVDLQSGMSFELGEAHYRRSEETWDEAGRPAARVAIRAEPGAIVVDIVVETPTPVFVPRDAVNPYDNEHPDINGHGVQLYFASGVVSGAWMLVPELPGPAVRVRRLPGWGNAAGPDATWRAVQGGFEVRARIPCDRAHGDVVALDVIVNDAVPDRVRRRGQLVMSGSDGEFVYLRGDRHHPSRLIPFSIT